MKIALAVGAVLCSAIAAHATSFSVVGTWLPNGADASSCSDSSSTLASCNASAPGATFIGPDGMIYPTGGSSSSVSEGFGTVAAPGGGIPNGIEIVGQADLQARGLGFHPSPSQPDVLFSGSVDLPSSWGNVNVNSFVFEYTDQYDGSRPSDPFYLTAGNGQVIVANGTKGFTGTPASYTGTFLHRAGEPFTVSWTRQEVSCCVVEDSSDFYQVDLIFSPADPAVSDIPEPSSWLLLGVGILPLVGLRKVRVRRTDIDM